MRRLKKYLSIILVVCLLMSYTTIITVSAFSVSENTDFGEDAVEELEPQKPTRCSYPSNYDLFYTDGRIKANVHFDHSHGGMQPHVHVYTWHQGPNGMWNSSKTTVEYDSTRYPRP